jgi:hypothetical protein
VTATIRLCSVARVLPFYRKLCGIWKAVGQGASVAVFVSVSAPRCTRPRIGATITRCGTEKVPSPRGKRTLDCGLQNRTEWLSVKIMRGRGCFAPCAKKSNKGGILKFDIVQIHCKLKPYASLRREKEGCCPVIFEVYNSLYGIPGRQTISYSEVLLYVSAFLSHPDRRCLGIYLHYCTIISKCV